MCGLFAFIGREPDPKRIRSLAALAGRRGPHACGWARSNHTGGFIVERRLGSLTDHAEEIEAAEIVVSHSRLATTGGGSYRDLGAAQPLTMPAGAARSDVVFAHNGVARIEAPEPLATSCDSEALFRLALAAGLKSAIAGLPTKAPYAVILAARARLWAARRGLPLFVRHNAGGAYLCSVAFAGARETPEDEVLTFDLEGPVPRNGKDKTAKMPVSTVRWVPRDELRANSWNPNIQAGPEFALLKVSILECGWTQPIVAKPDGEIVDGYHRWKLSADPEVAELTDGFVPVVYLPDADPATLMMSTVRHNRARGTHAVLKMGDLVRSLADEHGVPQQEIMRRLGMEDEEVDRLIDTSGMIARGRGETFNRGWVPEA